MFKSLLNLVVVILCFASVNTKKRLKFYEEKNIHEAQELTDQNVSDLAALSDMTHFRKVLDEILVPRVVGTPNHDKVGNFISQQMRDLGWDVTENVFSDTTPIFGTLNFKNIIAKLNPNAERFLVLACHYDSKYMREHVFDVLVLLDLLGAPDPVFFSYFQSTEKWYVRLAVAEQRLAELNQFEAYSRGKVEQTYFRLRSSGAVIEDDHIPFMRRNVDILHVIPSPFPSVWHTPEDNMAALDFKTIENLNKIFRVFVAEYLHIQPK
uniref:glutaminyl-peptide cyclotransferase n=1 Tax=Heliothis virescens TaxID=7102 RepID=A0A2A4JKC7_HELVI